MAERQAKQIAQEEASKNQKKNKEVSKPNGISNLLDFNKKRQAFA